ncbi:hypothetical protein B0680_06515, partial [Moraxella pluranimalium]
MSKKRGLGSNRGLDALLANIQTARQLDGVVNEAHQATLADKKVSEKGLDTLIPKMQTEPVEPV